MMIFRAAFFIILAFSTVSSKSMAKCDVLALGVFEAWNVLHRITGRIAPANYKEGVVDFSEGKLFRDQLGRSFLLPKVERLMSSSRTSSLVETYELALRNLRSLSGGADWFKNEVSEEIRGWAIRADKISYVGEDVISHPFKDRSNPYTLPDGSIIYLNLATREKLLSQWANRFRPGDM